MFGQERTPRTSGPVTHRFLAAWEAHANPDGLTPKQRALRMGAFAMAYAPSETAPVTEQPVATTTAGAESAPALVLSDYPHLSRALTVSNRLVLDAVEQMGPLDFDVPQK